MITTDINVVKAAKLSRQMMDKFDFFKSDDFIEPICFGETRSVFDQIADRANEVLFARRGEFMDLLSSEEFMSTASDWEKLRALSLKLRGIGHLLEAQDPDYVRPDDIDAVQHGMSLLINEISMEIRDVSLRLEEQEMKSSK